MMNKLSRVALPAVVALLAGAGNASAAVCLQDAYGSDPGCTANDASVASITVTNVSNNDCGGATNSFTFDGELNLNTNSAKRYDFGFYISRDSVDALTGECSVYIIPQGISTDDDGDTCGDYDGNNALAVPVTGVTAVCADGNNDGFFDVALCTAYDNNKGTTCNGPDDALPGTTSKCDCVRVDTDVEIPHCDTNADCEADQNVCTDAVCLGLGQPGADSFGCGQVNNTAPCDDQLFCNGTDVCSNGSCGHSGDPCIGGDICGDACNEADDNCFDPAGTLCRAANGVCDLAEECTGSSASCPANDFADSGVCRAANGVCDTPESCDGNSADCPADGYLSGTLCRGDAGVCDVPENCPGNSPNCPADSFEPSGTACTDDSNVCTDDECDGSGTCNHNNNTDPCDDGLFCTVNDVCSAGECDGSARDCSDAIDCTDDSCNEGANTCDHNANDDNCEDANNCTSDVCSISDGGCVFDFICTQDICRSPGYWATHSGYEKEGSINVGQEVLDAIGGLEVCGQTITATSNQDSPFLDGLGLESDLQGLCMRAKGVKQRQLYRQLVAAGLNCGISGGDCDTILEKYVAVNFSDCSDLCAGNPPVDGPTVGECVANLGCFNSGGQMIEGECVYGIEGNCHDAPLCNEGLGVCPKKTSASSPAACQEARFDGCTIDSCQ